VNAGQLLTRQMIERERRRSLAHAAAAAIRRAEERARLRAEGEDVPEPAPGSREALEDKVLAMALAARDSRMGRRVKHLSVLPGGGEDTPSTRGAAAGGRSGQLRHGGKPPFSSGESIAAHPSIFDTEETK
jgi:hypothetical protein